MRERVAALVGPVARTMWVSTFHSACVRILRANADRLGYPRQFSIYDQADTVRLTGYVIRDLHLDAKRFTPRGVHGIISLWKNELLDARRCRGAGAEHLRPQARRGLRRVPGPAAQGRGDGLRRPADEHRAAAARQPRRPRALPRALRAHPRRRVPGHEPGPERDRPAPRRRPPQRHRRRRHRPVGVPVPRRRLPEHPAVRGGLPGGHHGRAGPELPQHADDPRRRQRGHLQQRRPQAEEPVDRRRQRRSHRALPRRGRGRRGDVRGVDGPPAAQRRRHELARRRRAVPHERPEPRSSRRR